jgi:hypothetical protein
MLGYKDKCWGRKTNFLSLNTRFHFANQLGEKIKIKNKRRRVRGISMKWCSRYMALLVFYFDNNVPLFKIEIMCVKFKYVFKNLCLNIIYALTVLSI